jgi:hypothetical protein
MNAPDRIEALLKRTDLTGIDFIYVYPEQTRLDVHFLWDTARHDLPSNDPIPIPLAGALSPGALRIYSPTGAAPDVPILGFEWDDEDKPRVLRLQTAFPGDFTRYRLLIDDATLDPFFNEADFSFKANCPGDLDCAPLPHECPPEEPVDVPVDYLARDFWSYRSALLEMAAQRYPDWPDRLEADAGVMLLEAMSALADEMAYYQDRIAREAFLETATQRRSLRRHARLVDYHLHDGLGATAWLDVSVDPAFPVGNPADMALLAGTDISAVDANGGAIAFEIGKNIREVLNQTAYPVSASRNEFQPHIWDNDHNCLPLGATELYIKGHWAAQFSPNDQTEGRPGQVPGRWALLQTFPSNPAQAARAHLVRIIGAADTTDPLAASPEITRLNWEEEQALPFELDMTVLKVRGNLVPASSGKTHDAFFVTGDPSGQISPEAWEALRILNGRQEAQRAVARQGRDTEKPGREEMLTYLFTLPGSDQEPLVWQGADPRDARPEIELQEMVFESGQWRPKPDTEWQWRRALVGVNSSQPEDAHYTLDDGSWRRVVGYQRNGEEFVHQDYAANAGVTIRFGDGEFGSVPGAGTVFRVAYRLGGTRRSNVPADTLTKKGDAFPAFVTRITNPRPASGGLDAETPAELRQLAPDAFRALTYRAVRPEDYAEAAERLPWVQRAGAAFRWTGSWLSAFTTPDPRNAYRLDESRQRELARHLDRFRQAGRESHVMNPVYANLDLEIDVCALPDAYPGEVKERVLRALLGRKGAVVRPGYFAPDRFTFGSPLERSTLEAAIQALPGVRAVMGIRIRRRGWFAWRDFSELSYFPGKNTVIRVANDPLHPGRGSLNVYVKGGA